MERGGAVWRDALTNFDQILLAFMTPCKKKNIGTSGLLKFGLTGFMFFYTFWIDLKKRKISVKILPAVFSVMITKKLLSILIGLKNMKPAMLNFRRLFR